MILRSVCELEAIGSDGSFNEKTAQKWVGVVLVAYFHCSLQSNDYARCVQCWPEEIVEPADLTAAKRWTFPKSRLNHFCTRADQLDYCAGAWGHICQNCTQRARWILSNSPLQMEWRWERDTKLLLYFMALNGVRVPLGHKMKFYILGRELCQLFCKLYQPERKGGSEQ